MGFFNKILKGLGFADEEDKPKKPKQEKKEKTQTINATYHLKKDNSLEKPEEIKETIRTTNAEQTVLDENKVGFSIVKVSNQVEVQEVVTRLKNNEALLVNMSALKGQDLTRSMDFLTGAIFALGLTMQKIEESIFLIQ